MRREEKRIKFSFKTMKWEAEIKVVFVRMKSGRC